MKRNLLSLLLTVFAISFSSASHYSAAYVTYAYVGNITGNPFDYAIEIGVIRDNTGATIDLSPTELVVSSSCYSDTLYSIPKILAPTNQQSPNDAQGGFIINDVYGCKEGNNSLHLYRDTISIKGQCPDFLFEVSFVCCRSAFNNLASSPNVNIYATLNNSVYPTSHPSYPISLPTPKKDYLHAAYCFNAHANLLQFSTDVNADSLLFTVDNALEGAAGAPYAVPFNTGYSINDPVPNANDYTVNPKTGNISFTAADSIEGTFQIPILMKKFRFDPTTLQWLQIGGFHMETYMEIINDCNGLDSGITVNHADPSIDTLQLECSDTVLYLRADQPITPTSVTSTDIRITGNNHQSYPVKDVLLIGADSLKVTLVKPFGRGDTLVISTKKGMDGNALINFCGFDQIVNDSLLAKVHCNSGISINEITSEQLKIYPNPAKTAFHISGLLPNKIYQVEILNIGGVSVFKDQISDNKGKISIEHLPKGPYLVQIGYDNKTIKSTKLLVE